MNPECCILHVNDIVDGFKIVDKLGEGTFGTVYKVVDKSGNVFALKLLKLWSVLKEEDQKSLLGRFNMEFETGRINSKYLVRSINYGMLKGNPYILMEYCSNGDLKKLMGKGLSNNQINSIAVNILKGLYALHINGKVHRDLKPENVLFDENDNAKLTDFGISGDKNKRMTKADIFGNLREIFGTYAYMPKEQLNPKKDVTVLPTTDIFSFGVVMYELFTGYYPFGPINDNNELAEYNRRKSKGLLDEKSLANKNVSKKWQDIISKSLNPDYTKRFQSTVEILDILGASIDSSDDMENNNNTPYNFYTDRIGLQIMQGEEYGRVYDMSEMLPGSKCGVIRMGRRGADIENQIDICEMASNYVSRQHATIEKNFNKGKWYIRDGQWTGKEWRRSTNGTFINSVEVSEYGMELLPNSIVSIGDVTLKVVKL